jgi:cell division protease FtsH
MEKLKEFLRKLFHKDKVESNDNSDKSNQKKQNAKFNFMYMLLGFAGLLLLGYVVCFCIDTYNSYYYTIRKVDYTVFQNHVDNGEVSVVYWNNSDIRYVTYEDASVYMDEIMKHESAKDAKKTETELEVQRRQKSAKKSRILYETSYPDYEDFKKTLLEKGIILEYQDFTSRVEKYNKMLGDTWINLLMMFCLYYILMSQVSGLFLGMGKTSKATKDKSVKFDDIIGLDESLDDIKFTLKVMSNKKFRKKHNLKSPKGLLLSGPPGTGKTMIVKAISNELNIKMIYVDSSSLIQMYVGVGAARIREIFKEARNNKPCIIFFDEIDSIGVMRGDKRSSSENDQTLNSLLQEMDGFDGDDGIFVIGATNIDSQLDKALLRPGRFDKKIIINPPKDIPTRKQMYEHYLMGEDISQIDLDTIAKQSSGFTGADIAQVVNEAKMIAVAQESDIITTKVMEESIDKVWFKGNKSKHTMEEDMEITAYHESGHALSSLINNMPIARISISPNTSGVGGMVVNEDSLTSFISKRDIVNRIKMAYAGRIAEELIFGKDNITTGASQDIKMATELLKAYVDEFGFDSEFGLVDVKSLIQSGYVMESKVTDKISELSKQYYKESYDEISSNLDILKKLAEVVKQEETIDGTRLKNYYETFLSERE